MRYIVTLCLIVVGALQLSAQKPGAQSAEPAVRQAIEALYHARSAGDADGWARHVTADYVITHSSGQAHSRAEEVAEIKAAGAGSKPQLSESHIVVYGDTALHFSAGDYHGQQTRATDVWVRQQGEWKIAAAHLCRIAPTTTPK